MILIHLVNSIVKQQNKEKNMDQGEMTLKIQVSMDN